ncbi:hypothetical protein ACIQU5_32045 [Streptomyces sp. NPDC090306]|uniref:hypothetical protein n=1 Tax=Streptomyces sp. NPDC090306 TaxID=3365961 RepID=UPI00380F7C32
MTLDTPETSSGDTTWTITGLHGTAGVSFSATFTVEGDARPADGDAALQDMVDALTAKKTFSRLYGVKSYTQATTQVCDPTT